MPCGAYCRKFLFVIHTIPPTRPTIFFRQLSAHPLRFHIEIANYSWELGSVSYSLNFPGHGEELYTFRSRGNLRMATILFFNQSEQGHINPTLPLVAELVRRGEQVIYYSLEAFKPAFNPAFAQESASIGESLRQAGGYMRAADEIQRFMYNQLAKHLGKNEPMRWNEIC
jgi:hypothetical protein